MENASWVNDVHRYSKSRPDVKGEVAWRVLSWHGPHLSRRNEFRHTEYCRRGESPALVSSILPVTHA